MKRLLLFCVICFVFLASCNPTPQLSPMQIREITTKLFEADYENTYRATITVLQDQSYTIKMTDMNSGLINATVDRKTSGGNQFLQALLSGHVSDKGSLYELSCMVNKISDTSTEIRLNLHQSQYGQSSLLSGTSQQDSKQIYDPKVYKQLFDQIEVEIQRRIAIKK